MRLYIDVEYIHPSAKGTYGPFGERETAERALVAIAGRADVHQAHIRNPDSGAEEDY